MKRVALLIAAACVMTACGSEPETQRTRSGPPGPTEAESSRPGGTPSKPRPAPSVSPSPVAETDTTEVELWYSIATDTRDGAGLFPVRRTLPATPAIGAATIRAWLEGPTQEERDAGIRSSIPPRTDLLGLDISDGTAVVDMSGEFETPGAGSFGELMLLEELAWTLTQFPTVRRVLLHIEGRAKAEYMSHGFVIDEEHPLTRDDDDPLAPIIVTGPAFGQSVRSGDEVTGTANVFEANVSIRVRGEDGRALYEGFATATCGTGCRGDYSETVEFTLDRTQPGVVEVFEHSAEDGSEINKVTIPVVLES